MLSSLRAPRPSSRESRRKGWSRGSRGSFWGRIEDDFLETRGFSVEIRDGEDRARNRDRQDDFLFWSLLVELEAADRLGLDHYVAVTGRLLECFWNAGISAVATCGFEHLLPWSGGIRSPGMPPPGGGVRQAAFEDALGMVR